MADWSAIRKKLEEDYLCPALRGRIQYFITKYRESHDQEGRVAVLLDGEEILQSSDIAFYLRYYELCPSVGADAPEAFQSAYEGAINDGCFDRRHFFHAFHLFDNQSVEESMNSDNPLVRVLALLDRRLGKRRLLAIAEKMEQELPWVRAFYVIRMKAEGLMEAEENIR